MSATINLGFPATLDAKLNYKDLNAFSSSSVMIEHRIDGEYAFEYILSGDLKLTPAAQNDVEDPDIFRKLHGDYFVCGYQRRYSFRAILNCK